MKHMMKKLLAALLAAALLLSAAAAEGAAVSDREKAIRIADRALEETYGITQLTQEYFERYTEEKEDGVFVVEYAGFDFWAFVLGTYLVTVDHGAVKEISWSHDGEDTSGGLQAEAWGKEQILEMLRLNQESGDISLFSGRIDEINLKHGLDFSEGKPVDEEKAKNMLRAGNEPEQAEQMAALSVEELREAAKQALIEVYELNEKQAAWTYLLDDDEYDDLSYTMFHGIPCLVCCYGVGDDEAEKDALPNGILYSDKEGTYWIYVNVQTGETVEIFYTAGIGGNG